MKQPPEWLKEALLPITIPLACIVLLCCALYHGVILLWYLTPPRTR